MHVPCPSCGAPIDILVGDGSWQDGFDRALSVEINERACACTLSDAQIDAILDAAAAKAAEPWEPDEDWRRCDWR